MNEQISEAFEVLTNEAKGKIMCLYPVSCTQHMKHESLKQFRKEKFKKGISLTTTSRYGEDDGDDDDLYT